MKSQFDGCQATGGWGGGGRDKGSQKWRGSKFFKTFGAEEVHLEDSMDMRHKNNFRL